MKFNIPEQFRTDMNWLHTWAGICLGTMLFIIFWMGTLSVFDKEIDQWMKPEIRIHPAEEPLSADQVLDRIKEARPDGDISGVLIYMPRFRKPYYEVSAGYSNQPYFRDRLHPETGESLGESLSAGASDFIYPMHYRLMIGGNLGYWIVAFGTIFMMILLVTGVVIHRKIFKDFFTFRPAKSIGRSSLDLHNVTGTVFLPFHFMICLSGFAIFAGFYASLPFAVLRDVLPENRAVEFVYAADEYGYYRQPTADEPAEMLSLDPLVAQAETMWTERYDQVAKADRIDIYNYGDRDAVIEVRRHFPGNRTEARRDSVNFNGSTGEIEHDWHAAPIRQIRAWMEGFHQAQFNHWTLLWLYFIGGLAGCVLIATGFIFWLTSRRRKTTEQALNIRLVEAMSAASTTGVVAATFGYFVVNRLLAGQTEFLGMARESAEMQSFFVIWLLTFIHAVLRKGKAWMDQSWLIAGLAIAAVLLNWVTTGAHLAASASAGMWSVFGVDLSLLVAAVVAALAAVRLRQHEATSVGVAKNVTPENSGKEAAVSAMQREELKG